MRAAVLCGVALTLLFVATNAIRTIQGERTSRISRRLTTTERVFSNLNKTEDIIPTIRSRNVRRREGGSESSTLRSRSRTTEREVSDKNETQLNTGHRQQFESRKSNIRSRTKAIEKEAVPEKTSTRESIVRGRSRQSGIKYTSTSTLPIDQPPSSSNIVSTTLSPRSIDSNVDIAKIIEIAETRETVPSNQFRRRSSTVSTIEEIKPIKYRGRINTRSSTKALDLEVAGTTNTFTAATKQQILPRPNDDRSSRKLRYKTRTSETETNLTDEDKTVRNDIVKSSEGNDVASQPEFKETTSVDTKNSIRTSTESISTLSTLKSIKVVRRPITRNNGYFKSSEVKTKSKISDEINEDDNYPESFKALIQAKNATQSNSSTNESLSLQASEKESKSYTPSTQSIITGPGTDKNSRLRKKFKNAEKDEKEEPEKRFSTTTTTASNLIQVSPKSRSSPYRTRGAYSLRGNKFGASKSTPENIANSTKPNTESQYKFSRKFKTSTDPSKTDMSLKTKRVDSLPKKQVVRSSLFSRKNDPINKNFTVIPLSENRKHDRVASGSRFKSRRTLPNTSYYSRLRNNSTLFTSENNNTETNNETPIADKKVASSADLPLIFTYLNKPSKVEQHQSGNDNNASTILDDKESLQNSTENEVLSKADEYKNMVFIIPDATTQKYHANYKEDVQSEKSVTSATPVIRNIKTRRYGRRPDKPKDEGITTKPVVFKNKERNVRKFGDTFSKTTETPGNSISQELEKPKHKFSSKYRSSYLDKPYYKPTVPTVTPSTAAWEKFFATDEYTKSVEEPIMFGNDFFNITTDLITRSNFTSPTFTHESSIQLVEGEEIQLGPDMNAIAITKTRRPLSSADLRLSESLAKPLQVLNVEASQHSPSVTVSIFDALAEILTSTPKPRISTTTEFISKQTNEINMHTLDGVSNNVNVNTVTGFASQETVTSKDNNSNTNAKFLQTTQQFVFNSLPVGDNVTPSLKAEDESSTIITSPKIPTPNPTTPISARKPFAIKVLYSETESTKDNSVTVAPSTSATSTDKPTMVYNSISDLLLSNNGLVSSGLTSMLSNNIRNIIDSMDDESKSRLSVGMTNLLNTLTPSAINNVPIKDNDGSPYMTTPYSLEDIRDTENVDINFNNTANNYDNILQNVGFTENIVNITGTLVDSQNEIVVNSTRPLENVKKITQGFGGDAENLLTKTTASSTYTTSKDIEITTNFPDSNLLVNNKDIENLDETFTNNESLSAFINPVTDITTESSNVQLPLSLNALSLNKFDDSDDLQNPSQISPLQLWILSKKSQVLKMIEDLLRKHSDEISNPPDDIKNINRSKISLSSRFTEIMNTMNFSTVETDSFESTTVNFVEKNFDSSPTVPFTTTILPETITDNILLKATTQNTNDISFTTFESTSETASEIADALTTTDNSVPSTTVSEIKDVMTTMNPEENNNENLEIVPSTTPSSIFESTTDKTEILFDTTPITNTDGTTVTGIETTTATIIDENKSADLITISNMLSVATRPTIPKKDFVIFGILPNNTVVRKDPNDNPLEALTEASPYIIYGVLPNNTIIRKFPNGTRIPQIMQKIDVLPISPWSLKNPYSPIHNIPAIVRPQSNPIRVSTNSEISTDISNNDKETRLTTDTVNNLQVMIPTSALNIKDSSSLGIITTSTQPFAEKSTASHVLSLRTTTMLPSVDEILLNSISLATKEEMIISSMTSSTPEPRILTLDIDPETKQIRTEKPNDGTGTIFKFIPIEDVTVPFIQKTNVLKLASPKTTRVMSNDIQTTTMSSTTEVFTQSSQIQTNTESNTEMTSTAEPSIATPFETFSEEVKDEPPTPFFMNDSESTTESLKFTTETTNPRETFTPEQTTVASSKTTTTAIVQGNTDDLGNNDINEIYSKFTTNRIPMATSIPIASATNTVYQTQTNAPFISTDRNAKNLAGFNTAQVLQNQQQENVKLLQALLSATAQNKNNNNDLKTKPKAQVTTTRSIEDDIRQFEEDTKLLKALLQATGRDPASLNIPSLGDFKTTTISPTERTSTIVPITTTETSTTTQKIQPVRAQSNTVTIASTTNIRLKEDTKLLQALLQATESKNNGNTPIISGFTSNVRIASNPLTTSMESQSTTSLNVNPVYTTTQAPSTTVTSPTITVSTLQPTTEDVGISTTFRPVDIRARTTTNQPVVTTEIPSSSTYSDEEDLLFLKNLKSVLSTQTNNEDPETSLANRVIALAVERSLNEIQVGKSVGTTKVITTTTARPTTTTTSPTTTTTRQTTTTTKITTTQTTVPRQNIPSIEDDIKQFEQDTKLLQALLKATGQDPSKFNIPTLPTTTVSQQLPQSINDDLKLLSNLLASPSPLNEPFDPLTQKPNAMKTIQRTPTTATPGFQIAVKDDLKNEQDDAKLLQTLIKLQDAQETTTIRSKLAITGHSPDEALQKLIQKTQPAVMLSESTKPSLSLSTEYGNSNDALLAALLKEQGFGPTTASSLDEQIRLAALLNQVVVTPKARRTTTPLPPPPAPRRPILDGLAWLWQQWRDTSPGAQSPRQTRPAPTRNQPAQSASTTSSRVNWFGSGPFVGNANERPTNRIPLEPPSAVEQPPGRGQLVSAAINVTRAFSQFLGAAIQGAAQTVQNVFRAGQKAATNTYTTGSGGSG